MKLISPNVLNKITMKVGVVKIAEDEDFTNLKQLIDDNTGWDLEYNKSEMQLYTRKTDGAASNGKTDNSFKQLKVSVLFFRGVIKL